MFNTLFFRVQNKRYTYSNLRIVILCVIVSVVLPYISCVNRIKTEGLKVFYRGIEAHEKGHYQEACNYYEQAINANPENNSLKIHDIIYSNWGMALVNIARQENNKNLYEASIGKYKKAIELNPNHVKAYNNWGAALSGLARLENNIEKYKNDIFEVLLKAEKLEEGSGAYNLACLHSHLNEKDTAFKYLKNALWREKRPDRDYIEKDTDLDNLKSDPRFEELLDEYFPKGKS